MDDGMAIATLIASGKLDDRLLDRTLGLLRELDPKTSFLAWIDEGDAADLRFSGSGRDARWALDGLDGVDIVVQPEEPRWKRLFVADMDSTIIGQECIDELADYAGMKDKVARITERAMQGELDFPGALRERVRLLAGLDERELHRCLTERVHLTDGARTLVQTMRAGGSSCLLVSGGFLSFAEPVARMVGFDRVKANRLVFAGGKLSGEVGDPIVDGMAKRDSLIEARERLGLKPRDVMAIGDGANDKSMIQEAGLGVAFRAKPALVEVADAELRYHGLDALLWVQGVRRRDWFRK
ncbi:phosphoserine phosphatase SerB [Sphingomonas flavescens]|uniref:phosphoserine phosphatase SerB n=1 Tax=Sphingomonas flavescens TaxID=3132797 RepID=UPI0028048154|nr:phosphoserine phosphatase SerB [Sphingomonas limnosediminicola]